MAKNLRTRLLAANDPMQVLMPVRLRDAAKVVGGAWVRTCGRGARLHRDGHAGGRGFTFDDMDRLARLLAARGPR